MNVTHQRPGVYSAFDASTAVSGRWGGKAAAVVALSEHGNAGTIYDLSSYDKALETFTAGEDLAELIRLLFANGAGRVYAVPVDGDSGYATAFTALEQVEDVAVELCDSTSPTIQQSLRDSVRAASESRRERLAVIFGGDRETATQLAGRAVGINCERVVLVAPGGAMGAAAVAGAIAGESDPAMPLGGVELKGITSLTTRWSDSDIDTLVLGGVTPLELSGGVVSVVRAVTTRTKTGSVADATWRELTTIRVVDDVIPGLRNALRAKFSRAKNTAQGRGAIRSQVIVELESKVAQEIITGYDNVTVSAQESDPEVCLVEFQFTVAHGLNQIWLSAHITV